MARPVYQVLLAAALFGPLLSSPVAFAQQPVAEVPAPRFDINRFEISGNTLLPETELQRLVAPYTGAKRDFSDVQRALETLEEAYRSRGYGIVQVLLPEQDITKGVVRFRVLEPRVGRVVVEGNKFFNEANIRSSLPTVREGTTPNSRDIARNLQMLNEHPLKQTNVVLRAGASEDQVDVNAKITDEKPWRVFLTLDNTGTSETGNLRAGVGFQHTNLLNRDHQFTVQYVTSPTQIDDVTIIGAGYRIPVYRWNSSFDLIAGYSDVNSGTLNVAGGNPLNVSGSGTIGAFRWNYYLPKWDELEQKLTLGWDYRAFRNQVADPANPALGLVPDITIHPLSLTYSALRRFASSELSFYGSVALNVPFGSDGDAGAFTRPGQRGTPWLADPLCATPAGCRQAGANENYSIFRFGGSYSQALPGDWQVRLAINGQWTNDALISGEQFGLGGPDSVRGYDVREVSGDRGYQGQLELYTPNVARLIGLGDAYRLRLLAFADYGVYSYNFPQPGAIDHDSISSMGVGLRFNYSKMVSLRLDVAQIMQPTPSRATNSQRVIGALAVIY